MISLRRSALLALVVAVTALLVSGCGGPDVRAIALKQAQAEVNPRVLRVEQVAADPADGVRWAVALVHADSAFHLRCLPVPGHGSRDCHPRYAVVPIALNVGNNVTSPGAVAGKFGLTGSQVAAIAKARRASSRFTRFPDFPGWPLRCTIPRPAGGSVSGRCETSAQPPHDVRYVNFTEYWTVNEKLHQDHWLVRFDSRGRVRSVRYEPRFSSDMISRLLG